ncbi:MAG: DUF6867 family protein [Geminicoccaceae bacterium]
MSTAIIGQSVGVFIVLTAVFGLCAWLAGQAQARGWQPLRMALLYAGLLALAHRFLLFSLRQAHLLDILGLIISLLIFGSLAYAAYAKTRADRMVSQYPWLYQRKGVFGWQEIGRQA